MTIAELKSEKIGILGFGQEGQAVLHYLAKNGISATVYDKNFDKLPEDTKQFAHQYHTTIVQGENYLDTISESTVLFRSPGVWRNEPKILEAERKGSVITSQTKWFFENCPATIIGITGTKGKGTTSSIIYDCLKASFRHAYLTGNIGKIQPLEFLSELKASDFVVYELSSFQLQDLTISPHIGICLMVTSDHLDHHENLDEYHNAKASICAHQNQNDFVIYNSDHEASVKIGEQGLGQKYTFSTKSKPTQGAYIDGEKIILTSPFKADIVIDCSNRTLRGVHNLENIAAATIAASILDISTENITKSVTNFKGLEHRLQLVGEQNEVMYYNDSISTVPDTTIAALNSFTEPVHLLLGGSNKGLDYTDLVKDLISRKNIASITLLGKTGNTIKQLLDAQSSSIPTFGPYTDFALAIKETKDRAKKGDVVLLSPASASFDMFKNYAERGTTFVKLVSE